MRCARISFLVLVCAAGALLARPAHASFHVMQIEQVIAGVDGATSVQAIQLRMRSGFQNQVQLSKIVAHDANGLNPVLLLDIGSSVPNSVTGSRVLLATAGFQTSTNPNLAPDFLLTNPIPDSYLPAGSLTFESDGGIVYWRLSWGGANYLGPSNGDPINDADGNYGPAYAGALPSGSGVALLFQNAASSPSTTNAADYDLTDGSAVFTKNSGASASIVSAVSVPGGPGVGIALGSPIPNPARGSMSYSVTVPRPMRVEVGLYDLAGRRVAGLVDGMLPAGRNGFSLDALDAQGRELSAGIYFLGMSAGGVRRTARFVLLGRGTRETHDD
jgi:hypothetical protein